MQRIHFRYVVSQASSDLFDKPCEQLRKELQEQGLSEADIAEELKDIDNFSGKYFYAPPSAHWSAVKHLKENVGTGLNKALEAIEDNNRCLARCF